MISKRTKQFLAQVLVVSIMLPNLNVQAITNTVSTQIIESTNVEESTITNSNNMEETNNTEEANKEDVTQSNESQSDISNEAIKEDVINESTNSDKSESTDEVTNENTNEANEETVEENSDKIQDEKTEENSSEAKDNINEDSKAEEDNENIKGKTYEKIKAIDTGISTFAVYSEENSLLEEREEFRLKKEAMENLEVLVPMTDENYELTIANADGSYEFVEAYSDIDSAIQAAENMPADNLKSTQLPAVINSDGQVVYSTNQMARILRYVNGQNITGNVNLYSNSSLTSAFTYVNQGYMDDAPILDMTKTATKVMISGYEGWINSNTSSGTYDMVVVPLNQAKNPSYYTVKNGELVHFISYDLTGSTGFSNIIGKAPSFLSEGTRYLSYDGQYFYKYDYKSQSSISSALSTLIDNYKNGNRNNAVNKNNPYYLYYLNLPFRSTTVYTAKELDNFISNHPSIKGTNSKLIGLGSAFKEVEEKYGVNALLALSIAINESNFGKSEIAQTKNNLFGLKAYDSSAAESASSFATPRDSVIDFAKNYISRGYADPADWRYYGGYLGNKNRGTNVKYASDPFWGEKAAKYAYEIDKYLSGGNSNLRDTNSKQIGMATADNSVIKKDGTLLYNVGNDMTKYQAYINTPFIISDLQKVTINGKQYYEIYPERNTPVNSGGTANQYHGNYNWNDKGYILASNVSLINVFVPTLTTEYGKTRYETAVELSKSTFTSAETIVICGGYAIPDGLAATPIASYYNAPLLLVEAKSIPTATQNEIKRLGAKNVIIVGGTGVVTKDVETQLKKLGITKITRLGGATRYETSLQVAKFIDTNLYDVQNVVIANGTGQADALSIAPVSGRDKMPILLVEANKIPTDVYNWLKSENLNTAYVIGGTGVVSDSVMKQMNSITSKDISGNRLGGATRYDTNAKVIERFYGDITEKVYITEGINLADALTAGPVAAVNQSPMVITGNTLTTSQKQVLGNKATNSIVQVGGVVSKTAVNNLKELLSKTK